MFLSKGFTLIEIIIAIAIFAMITTASLPVAWEFYEGNELRSEKNNLVALLENARTLSMANLNQKAHGIYISPSNFILFEGNDYVSRDVTQDKEFPRSKIIITSGATEVVFQTLSGQAASSTINLSSRQKSVIININTEGRVE